jgi:uncharacterized protein YdaU (DUF1376 family)
MPNLPWFKFFPSDYLLDPDVDAIPPDAEGLLIRMWCLCHLEGSCPANPEELARKTRRTLQCVLQCKRHCEPFFELHEGRLYSRRMEEEKRRSTQARENANKRYKQGTSTDGTANGSATGSAIGTAQSQSQSQSQIQRQERPSDAIASEPSKVAPIIRGTRLPQDFGITEEHRKFASEIGVDVDHQFAIFRDYWIAQPGQKGVKTEWNATFRNWLRRAVETHNRNGHGGRNGKAHHSGAPQPLDYTLTPDEAARRAGLEASRTAGARN